VREVLDGIVGNGPVEEIDRSRFLERSWQINERRALAQLIGKPNTGRLLGLKDCRELATVARFLEKAARLEPAPLLEKVEELCGPDTAELMRDATRSLLERLTGIDSLQKVARAFRWAGVLRCAIADALETCACLRDLQRDEVGELRAGAIHGASTWLEGAGS
jgi:hypothetical protein